MRLLKIGRDNSCDIVLHSDKVSSLHAEITLLDSGDMLLEDKGSSNGTFIMNQPVKPGKEIPIKRGDAIRFADVELQWSQIPMPEDNSAYNALYGIGTNFRNEIQLSGTTVSRYHATVKKGKDNKMYIFDHSKNGTTVDGRRIQPNQKERIKKKSKVVCGGVPVDLTRLPWPSTAWKNILAAAAGFLLLMGIGFGAYKLLSNPIDDDGKLYNRFKHSTVYIKTVYHYEVSIAGLSADQITKMIGVPQKTLPVYNEKGELVDFINVSNMTSSELLTAIDNMYEKAQTRNQGLGCGTGFFISNDGEIITNLHVVKPWVFNKDEEQLELLFRRYFAQKVANTDAYYTLLRNISGLGSGATDMSAYTSLIKVKGVLDYVAIVPNDAIFDKDNVIKCRVVHADEDRNSIDKDVAIIQTVSKALPSQKCTFVNVKDSMDISDDNYKPGTHVYVLGFPEGADHFLQNDAERTGIHCYGTGGRVTVDPTEYTFSFDAAALHGSSGSAIFNSHGMLIGLLNSGKGDTFNRGIKAKYIKEIIEKPHNYK